MTAASEGNEAITSRAARDTANALRDFTAAVRGVAATTKDQGFHNKIINSAHLVMEKSALLGMTSDKMSMIGNNFWVTKFKILHKKFQWLPF